MLTIWIPFQVKRLKHLRTSTTFRETWQYNNCMYTLLSALPPLLTNVPYTEYVEKNIFRPLGLTGTTYNYEIAKDSGNLADGFGRQYIDKKNDPIGSGTPRRLKYPNDNVPAGSKEGNCKPF